MVRHDALRLRFQQDPVWIQEYAEPSAVELELHDLSTHPAWQSELDRLAHTLHTSFDLAAPPLLKAALFQVPDLAPESAPELADPENARPGDPRTDAKLSERHSVGIERGSGSVVVGDASFDRGCGVVADSLGRARDAYHQLMEGREPWPLPTTATYGQWCRELVPASQSAGA